MLLRASCLFWVPVVVALDGTDVHDKRTIFYGPSSEHLGQLVSYLRLKAVVKAKAYDCKRIHYCTKGAVKSALFASHPRLDELMRYLSVNHRGILGALANGWLRKDCEKLYPKCFMKIRVVTSRVPCEPNEACFKSNDPTIKTNTTSGFATEMNTDANTTDSTDVTSTNQPSVTDDF